MKIFLLTICSFFCGCNAIIPTYSQEQIDSGLLAKIKAKEVSFFSGEWRAWIHEVYSMTGDPIVKSGIHDSNRMSELYLPAGRYRIVLECALSYGYANPEIIIDLKPGKLYRTDCVPGATAKNLFGVNTVVSLDAQIVEVEEE